MMRLRLLALAAAACALLLAAAAPADARPVEKAFWSPSGPNAFPIVQQLGVSIIQESLNWSQIAKTRPADPTNPNDPAYGWPTDADQAFAQAQQYGMKQLVEVSKTPSWASGNSDPRYLPTDPADYTNFLIAASRRYPSVRYWMIWSEACSQNRLQPITPQDFGTPVTADARSQPRAYAALLDASYATLKGISPTNIVIGGNSWAVCGIRPIDWAHYLKTPNGRRPRMDLWGHNPYIVYDPRKLPDDWKVTDIYHLPELQAAIDKYFGKRPRIGLFLSEFTMPTAPDVEFPLYTSERGQATFIKRAFTIARKLRTVAALGWLYLYDSPPGTGQTEGHSGGLLRTDGSEKPGFFVFRRE
jgi:hypothetical protein